MKTFSIRIILILVSSLCFVRFCKAALLIDDYSSEVRYNENHLNALGGYTGSGIAMEYDAVTDGILKLTWMDPGVRWYSYTSSETLLYTDMSDYTGLDFYIKGETGGEEFTFYLTDNNSKHEKRLTLTNSFSYIFVPFSSLSSAEFFNPAKVTIIEFNGGFSPNASSIYIDNISANTVPEAGSILLFSLGLIMTAAFFKGKKSMFCR